MRQFICVIRVEQQSVVNGKIALSACDNVSPGAISWDYEIATAFSQQGPAASGWTQRWRPGGMPGSRAALGLWDDGAGLLDEEANKARGVGHLSSQGNVDTAQEVGNARVGRLRAVWH